MDFGTRMAISLIGVYIDCTPGLTSFGRAREGFAAYRSWAELNSLEHSGW